MRVPPASLRRAVPVLALMLIVALAAPTKVVAQDAGYPFRDPSLPVAQRVDDLLGRLTLDEKLSLLHQSQAAIPRLDIPYFKAGTEALHGVAWSNDYNNGWSQVIADKATVFPQAVGLASTWNPSLIKKVGSTVGDEARAYNSLDGRHQMVVLINTDTLSAKGRRALGRLFTTAFCG